MVLTWVPPALRIATQLTNPCRMAGEIALSAQPSHTWWHTNGTQPPLWVSASSTSCCRSDRVSVDITECWVRIANGFPGGTVSAYGQPMQPTSVFECSPDEFRAEP